jgi:hypothetical protein
MHQDWYAAICTCLCCGETWSEGYLHERPFERAWRQKKIAQVIQHFNEERGIQ